MRGRKWGVFGTVGVAAAAAITSILLIAPAANGCQLTAGADVYVCSSGSDSNSGTINSPVQSLNAALQKISDTSAHTIQVGCGTYPAQQLNVNAARSGSTNYVTFQPSVASGICWNQADWIKVGTVDVSGPSYIKLKNFSYNGGIAINQPNDTAPTKDLVTWIKYPSDHITIDTQNGGRFLAEGAKNFVVQNSDLGNCRSNKLSSGGGVLAECDPGIKPSAGGQRPTGSVLNTKIHDITAASGNSECGGDGVCHTVGLGFSSSDGITLDGLVFYNNPVTDIRIQNRDGSAAGEMWGITIQNSWFADAVSGTVVPIEVDSQVDSLIIRFNSLSVSDDGTTRHSGYVSCLGGSMDTNGTGAACGTSGSHAKMYGNLMSNVSCQGNTDRSYNIFVAFSSPTGNTTCDASETRVTSIPYTSDPNPVLGALGAPNFDITGVAWTGDNYVPTSVTGGCPATDYHGVTRPVNVGTCDAGAVER